MFSWDTVASIATTVAATASIVTVGKRNHKDTKSAIADVKHEVKTGNALTLGQLGDATESRRIDAIPEGDRTSGESEHLTELANQKGQPNQ